MRRVVSLFLPYLAIERQRRQDRAALPASRPAPPPAGDAAPGLAAIARDGGWRPGARWARTEAAAAGATTEQRIAALPVPARPPMRELGRRSEAARHPFHQPIAGGQNMPAPQPPPTPTQTPMHPAAPAPEAPEAPLALVGKVGRRDEIVAACPGAAALGIHLGMAATHARAMVADLDIRPAAPDRDIALLDRLALLAVRRWTPVAMVTAPDGLWLDLTGAAHLHGGEDRFCRRLRAFCRRVGLTARVAIADTPGAAHALARYGRHDVTIVAPGRTLAALAPLPLAALRLEPGALGAARRFGFECIADILPVARGPLARRLGLPAIRRLDQATGAMAEPITPHGDPAAPCATRRLLEPIVTAEAICQVMTDILGDLAQIMAARGLGARALRLSGSRVDGTEQVVGIGTSRPTRDTTHLLRLLKLRIEHIDPGLGIEQFRLVALHTEPLAPAALDSDLGAVLAGEPRVRDTARLVDVIAGRIGEAAVYRIAPVPSHVPERAVTRTAPIHTPGDWPGWQRPIRLFARPEPLARVVALLPDQPPRRFEWRGTTHVVVAGDGPERIHGEWWRRDAEVWASRDYYRVEDERGGRWWVFRRGDGCDGATGDLTWWLHGVFA